MKSTLYSLDLKDITRSAVFAVLTAAFLPIVAAVQTPGFDVFTANWGAIGSLALNGAFIGFVTFLVNSFFTDDKGKVFGSI